MGFLDGYKTIIGGFGLIFTGLGMIAVCIKTSDYGDLDKAFATIALGWSIVGGAKKLDKMRKDN